MKSISTSNEFSNKQVLIFGLGILGGGIATTNWLIKKGAKITISDTKTKKELEQSLKKINGTVKLSLGGHHAKDIANNDIIVLNPAISYNHPLIKQAVKEGKKVINEGTIFFKYFKGSIIGVTGTRGKTTVSNWIAHIMGGKAILAGNSPKRPFLKSKGLSLRSPKDVFGITELSSFILELFDPNKNDSPRRPDIAVITNIYQDHLNRYADYKDYMRAKGNIFLHQEEGKHVILNHDNKWASQLLALPHSSRTWFFSLIPLPEKTNGIFWNQGRVIFQKEGEKEEVLELPDFAAKWGNNGVENLLASILASHLAGVSWDEISKRIETLPQIEYRQQTVFESKVLRIINDTTATSPEGTIAGIMRFSSPSTILITGGTDSDLDFSDWGKVLPNYIVPENIVMLSGSATKKMLESLDKKASKIIVCETLEECLKTALSKAEKFHYATILFSPASKSFEKFKNEYDRGEQFNKLIKKLL